MKKLLAIIAAMLAIINVAHAYDFESGGIYYNITSEDDKTVEVTSGDNNYSGDVVIPETVTYSDTEYTVTTIGDKAFNNCSSLASIDLPASVTSISADLFWMCVSLQNISVSEANENYTSIDGVVYDKNASKLVYCPNRKSDVFTVPSSVTTIGNKAFCGCSSLTSIELPESLTTIESSAFYECSSMTSIELPASVSLTGGFTFYACASLTSIVLPSSVKSVGDFEFYGCFSLTSVELPASVTSIGYWAFSNCPSLKIVTCLNPEPPTAGDSELFGCPIEVVYVPTDAVTAYQAAEGWKDFNIVGVANKNLATEFEVDGIYYHVLSSTDNTVEVISGDNGYTGDIIIPETVTYSDTEYSVTSIGERAFNWCTSLTNIELPSSVTSIGERAFNWCTSLTNIELPSSVTSIGERAFSYCTTLTTINLPSSLTSIGYAAFANCESLISIELPSLLTSIDEWAFEFCTSLQKISVSEANENYTSIDGVLYDKNVSTLIYYPGGKSGEFSVPSSVTTIGNTSFAGCTSLTSIELPSSVTEIGSFAFYASSLTSIELSSSVTKIGDNAFEDCYSLKSIEIPSSVTEIGHFAFGGCSSLLEISVSEANENYASVDGVLYDKNISTLVCYPGGKSGEFSVPSSVTEIGSSAFYASSLTSIELSSSVTKIGDNAFEDCYSLKNIEIPSSVTSIGYAAFWGCHSLTSIELPASVSSIDMWAFTWCESLKTIICLNPVSPTLGSEVFLYCPIEAVYVPAEAVEAYQSAEGWSEFNIVGMSNVGNEAVPVYVVSDIVEEEGTVQETREEVSFNFVEYSEVATGQGTATLTREGSSEVVNLPAAQIAGEAAQARALRVVAADGKDYQVVQPLGNAATIAGNYTIHFPEGYFLLGTQKENSPAFTMSFTVGDVSGITDAIINSADAEYYTLQGVKVQGKPAPGIYICRQGNKATKVVVK